MGGGAFSGKDPTKVDRSAAYICRQMAKSVVRSGLSKRCLVQLSYAIGVAKPLSLFVETYGAECGMLSPDDITNILKIEFDCRPGASLCRWRFGSQSTRRRLPIAILGASPAQGVASSSSSGRMPRIFRNTCL